MPCECSTPLTGRVSLSQPCSRQLLLVEVSGRAAVGALVRRCEEEGGYSVQFEALYEGGPNRQYFSPFITRLREQCRVVCLDGESDHRRLRLSRSDDEEAPPVRYMVQHLGEAVEALVEDFVDGRVERGGPHVLDDDGARGELEGGPAEHFRVVVGRRDLLAEPHRLRRVARIVRVVEEARADRLGRGGPAEGRAGESSHFGLGGAAGYGRRVSSELLRSTRRHLGSSKGARPVILSSWR